MPTLKQRIAAGVRSLLSRSKKGYTKVNDSKDKSPDFVIKNLTPPKYRTEEEKAEARRAHEERRARQQNAQHSRGGRRIRKTKNRRTHKRKM